MHEQVQDRSQHYPLQREKDGVADHVATHCGHLLIHGHDDAHGAANRIFRPPLFGMPRDVKLARRLAMALQAAVLYLLGAHIAESLLAPKLLHSVVLSLRHRVEVGQRLLLEPIGNILHVTGLEIGVSYRILTAPRKQFSHALAHQRAVQSLELVSAVGGVVDKILGVVDKVPYRIHLQGEHARLFQKRRLRLLALRVNVEHHERAEGNDEQT